VHAVRIAEREENDSTLDLPSSSYSSLSSSSRETEGLVRKSTSNPEAPVPGTAKPKRRVSTNPAAIRRAALLHAQGKRERRAKKRAKRLADAMRWEANKAKKKAAAAAGE
jgi:hypothetical protein